jgi:drug/metabolite transporter (DMT)-like permease
MACIYLTSPQLGDHRRGIAAILIAVFLLSFSDALIKLSGDSFGLAQLVLLRSVVAALLLATWLLAANGRYALGLSSPGWVWARSLSLAAMWLCYYAALSNMSFALAAACYYTAPVWMILMARFMLGVAISLRGWGAIALCLAGVLLMVGPTRENFTAMLLLPLAAAGFYALAGIITWSRCQQENAGAMAFTLSLCISTVAAAGLVVLMILVPANETRFVFSVWPHLGAAEWSLALLLGALLAIISTAVAAAYRLAPTPLIGVYDTAYLGFAAIWSAHFFGDILTLREALGLLMIAVSAITMNYRPADEPER